MHLRSQTSRTRGAWSRRSHPRARAGRSPPAPRGREQGRRLHPRGGSGSGTRRTSARRRDPSDHGGLLDLVPAPAPVPGRVHARRGVSPPGGPGGRPTTPMLPGFPDSPRRCARASRPRGGSYLATTSIAPRGHPRDRRHAWRSPPPPPHLANHPPKPVHLGRRLPLSFLLFFSLQIDTETATPTPPATRRS